MPFCERLELSLTVWEGERLHSRLGGLGYSALHPRFWADLPTDEDLYAGHAASGTGAGPTPTYPRSRHAVGCGGVPPFSPSPGPTTRSWPRRDTDVTWLPIGVPETVELRTRRGPLTDTSPATDCIVTALAEFRADSSSRRAPRHRGVQRGTERLRLHVSGRSLRSR